MDDVHWLWLHSIVALDRWWMWISRHHHHNIFFIAIGIVHRNDDLGSEIWNKKAGE